MQRMPRCSFLSIRVVGDDGTTMDYYKLLAYQDPLLLVRCYLDQNGKPAFEKTASGYLYFQTGKAALKNIAMPFSTVHK